MSVQQHNFENDL